MGHRSYGVTIKHSEIQTMLQQIMSAQRRRLWSGIRVSTHATLREHRATITWASVTMEVLVFDLFKTVRRL